MAEISAAVEENNKEAFKMGKANKEDRVVYRLKDSIDEFKKVRITGLALVSVGRVCSQICHQHALALRGFPSLYNLLGSQSVIRIAKAL